MLEQLGRSKEFSGDLVGAEAAYRRVGQLTDQIDLAVNCLRRRARVRQKQNRLTAAIRLLRQGERRLEGIQSAQWVDRRLAEIHLSLAGLRMDQGQLTEARREAEMARHHAEAANDPALTVHAFGAIVGALTDWSEAEPYAHLGLGPGAPAEAYEGRSILAINLGMAAFFAGRWSDAVSFYEQGHADAQALGNVTGAALAAMNAAEVLVDQGHLERAGEALIEVQRVLGAAGYAAALSYAQLLGAVVALRRDDLATAVPALQRCGSEFREGSMKLYALESELRLAEAWIRLGRLDDAATLATQAMDESEQLSRRGVIAARAQRLFGMVALAQNDPATGAAHLLDAVATCREHDLRYELAVTLRALAETDPGSNQHARSEAVQIFDELGVIESGRLVGFVQPSTELTRSTSASR